MTEFEHLADSARVWVFPLSAPIGEQQAEGMLAELQEFVERWASHGNKVAGAAKIVHESFILVAGDEQVDGVSGCSIDGLFRQVKKLADKHGASIADNSRVFYRGGTGVDNLTRPEFAELSRSGEITKDTIVFDNTISSLGDVRSGKWELPFAHSWHAQAFPLESAAS